MKIVKIQQGDSVAYRFVMRGSRGKTFWSLFTTGMICSAIAFWQWSIRHSGSFLFSEALLLFGVAFAVICLIGAFGTNIAQLDPTGNIRKGYRLLGLPLWIARISPTEIASLIITEDQDDILLKFLGATGDSILALEGFESLSEAEALRNTIEPLLVDPAKVVEQYVEELATEPPQIRISIRILILLVAVLVPSVFLLMIERGDSPFFATGFSVFAVGCGCLMFLRDEKITATDPERGVVLGWFRERKLWLRPYSRNFNTGRIETQPRKFDLLVVPLLLLIVAHAGYSFSIAKSRSEGAHLLQYEQPTVKEPRTSEDKEKLRLGIEAAKKILEDKRRKEEEQKRQEDAQPVPVEPQEPENPTTSQP